jgi:hypothetical protein
MRSIETRGHCFNWLPRNYRRTALLSLFVFSVLASALRAQTPIPAVAGSREKSQEGFTLGWGFGTRFEGSTSADGGVYDVATGVGYNFTQHFGVGLGVPYTFVGTPSSIKTKNPLAVSGYGIGNIGMDLKWLYPEKTLTYASTVHLAAPTGDTKKGFSTGHATWNWTNHFEHGWGNFTPFIDGGVGNTLAGTKHIKLYSTFGYNAQFEAGTGIDAGPLSFSASAYDVAPWGPQELFSKVFRCTSGTKCSGTGTSTDRKGYLSSSVTSGGASLARDNGFNAGVEVKPAKYLDLEADYSRSVPLQLNTFSFGISIDLGSLLRSRPGP